jgi:hypothetical protein
VSEKVESRRKKILFFDWRDIKCGHLAWKDNAGRSYAWSELPKQQIELHATPMYIPHGIRLVAQPARRQNRLMVGGGGGVPSSTKECTVRGFSK